MKIRRYIKITAFTLFALLFYFCESKAQQTGKEQTVKITEYVEDQAGILSASQKQQLVELLRKYDTESSTQVVVCILKGLEDRDIAELAHSIAVYNKIGQKGKNNGVLLLIAMAEKRMRIEVGYGLEGALPDALAFQIIENEIKPSFRSSNYIEGITKGVNAIVASTKGEYKADKDTKRDRNRRDSRAPLLLFGIPIFVILFFGIIIFTVIITIIRRIFGFGTGMYTGGGRGGWSNWGGGGFFGGGGSSGSSGFSGFSGGGGDFGGGGASGGW
ncbi:TPM domain-containing protein [bacterium]|nr:MAG: TPM domain-containing protein [bacterium]